METALEASSEKVRNIGLIQYTLSVSNLPTVLKVNYSQVS